MASISTWIDDFGPVREDSNKVTEEDVQRVQAQSKQAKQVAQQIKKDKAINNQLAKFLWILISEYPYFLLTSSNVIIIIFCCICNNSFQII